LLKAAGKHKGLKALIMYTNKIGKDGLGALTKAIETTTSLAELEYDATFFSVLYLIAHCYSVRYNSLGDESAAAIASAVEANTSLKTFHHHGNEFSTASQQAITAAFKEHLAKTEEEDVKSLTSKDASSPAPYPSGSSAGDLNKYD